MQTDYYIEDLVHQTQDLVVYRVVTREQIPLALIRLRYQPEILEKLQGGVFENALEELRALDHGCLRSVFDGGLDPVDGFPWIVARWWDGVLLPDRVRDSDLTPEEFNRIQFHGESLIAALGPFAGTVSFNPGSIITCGQGEESIDTFSIDYHAWFGAFARGIHPTAEADPYHRFNALLTYLKRQTQHLSTPLATGANPPEQASAPPQLASSTGSVVPLKSLLFLATLVGAIGFFSWKFINKTSVKVAEQSSEVIIAPTITPEEPAVITPAPIVSTPITPPSIAPPEPPPELRPTQRPGKRTAFTAIDPTSPYSLDGKVGKWVTFRTVFSGTDDNGHLIVPDSPIKVAFPLSSDSLAQSALRNKVTLWGFLTSPSLLRIVNPDDVEITYLLKEVYTIHDEKQIRQTLVKNGQIIPVRAIVTDLTKSGSGKTLYLQFKESSPEFAAAIEVKKAESSLSKSYLKSLIGKEIQVKGRAKKDTVGSRLSIVVTQQSQITVIE